VLATFLFTIVFIGLMIVVCRKDKLPDGLQTGLITLLGTLAGFFAGIKMKKE
jgi:hypothetical protein